jgi:acyl-CoA reductase-like NAD-dependent aldehyde dehydrogenase
VQRAKAAQVEWAKTSWAERRAVLMDLSDAIIANAEEIALLSTNDTGKTRAEAVMGELGISLEKCRWLCAHGEAILSREDRPLPLLMRILKRAYVEFVPVGVMGLIVPWNYPANHVLVHGATCLFAGNAALFKVSEYASASAAALEDIFRKVLANRGHSPDLVQVVTGLGATGEAVVKSGVDKILFIGSPAIGKKIMAAASERLTPVILELGGKDPFIVFDDCDFDHTIDIAVRGAFINCGQNCVSAERFYVHEKVYDRFIERMTALLKTMRLVRPTSFALLPPPLMASPLPMACEL